MTPQFKKKVFGPMFAVLKGEHLLSTRLLQRIYSRIDKDSELHKLVTDYFFEGDYHKRLHYQNILVRYINLFYPLKRKGDRNERKRDDRVSNSAIRKEDD